MTSLTIHTIETAPEGSKESLKASKKGFGMVPNLHAVLAGSPKILEAYKTLHKLFSSSSFSKEELTVIWQTINIENECHYCVPAHTAVANMMSVDPALSETLRNGETLSTEKLQTLQATTLSIVRNRGHLTEAELKAFYAVGYGEQQVLEIILGLAQKVISNYTNHIANTPIDAPFQKFAWQKETA